MNWLQAKVMPPMEKLASNKYLVAIQNGLVVTLPAVIAGSVFLILANIPIPAWEHLIKPYVKIMTAAVNGSFGIISLLAVIGISYQLGKALKIDAISGTGLAVMAFIITSFNGKLSVDTDNFSSSGLFTAIITAFVSVLIYHWFIKKNLVIKLPKGVPTLLLLFFRALPF